MATLITFTPTANANFQFNCVLDGNPHTVIVTWNNYTPRYYINVYDTAGQLIVISPLIGSPNGYDINLVFGYFQTSTLVYRANNNNFEITP